MSTDICPASPPGYFYRSNCELLCRPAEWFDVIVFFLGNYVAHILTVVSQPGQCLAGNIMFPALTLLFPGTGYTTALSAITSMAIFAPTELQMAARARALYMVAPIKALKSQLDRYVNGRDSVAGVRDEVETGDVELETFIEYVTFNIRQLGDTERAQSAGDERNNNEENEGNLEVPVVIPRLWSPIMHGVCRLPKGYCFIPLDRRARFVNDPEDGPVSVSKRILSCFIAAFRPQRADRAVIACDYNAVKILVAIVQLAFALVTLYRTRGDQIAMYGYAAFGLTVAQYAWMSLLNLAGSLMCPNYPSIFVVESQTLKDLRTKIEATGETARYPLSGTVGELTGSTEKEILENCEFETLGSISAIFIGPYLGVVPIAIIGGLSRFSLGGSALYQRVWTMMWLVFGFIWGPFVSFLFRVTLSYAAIFGSLNIYTALVKLNIYTALVKLRIFISGNFPGYDTLVMALELLVVLCFVGFYAAPAIGGFVVVGQMILDYGVCIRLR